VHLMYPRPFVPTFKEVPKDPLTDPINTFKEVRKDPITDPINTFKEVRKDPITDPVKQLGSDPIGGTFVEGVTLPGTPVTLPGQFGGFSPNPAGSPFILAGPSRVNLGDAQQANDMVMRLTSDAQQLLAAIGQSEQQHAQLMVAYDATLQALNQAQTGQQG
jgi:hypothetical protein